MRTDVANAMVEALTDSIAKVSVHTGDPGEDGSTAVATEYPSSTRQSATWTVGTPGQASATVTFTLGVGEVAYFGFWDSSDVWVHGQQFAYEIAAADDYEFTLTVVVPTGNGGEDG